MRNAAFWRFYSWLTVLSGLASTVSPPASFEKAGVSPAISVIYAVFMVCGGALLLVPYPQLQLAGALLPITAMLTWSVVLVVRWISLTSVLLSLMLVAVYVSRAIYLWRALRTPETPSATEQ